MASFTERLRRGWDAFRNDKSRNDDYQPLGYAYSYRPDRSRFRPSNEKSIIVAIYNRIAIDVAAIKIEHIKVDENGRYAADYKSGLSDVLKWQANADQTGRAFIQDVVMSMLDEGVVALVPTAADVSPIFNSSFEIEELRTGKILEWYPDAIRANVYNEHTGRREDLIVPKRSTAIVENPLYAIMNEPNSTLKRLIRKLNILDAIDEQSGANKLDIIIQLPYTIKTEARREQAERRRKDIETQLSGSKYGIAYTDGTEHITQLNRSAENNLMTQIEYLTKLLYSQLGITEEVMNGTASEEVMLNYYNRTIEPILSAITDEMSIKFLTKTARSQNQRIVFFRDPFRLAPINSIADIADKFTRNEILTSNEFRSIIGFKPSDDPDADVLRNKNLNQSTENQIEEEGMLEEQLSEGDYNNMMGELDDFDSQLDELEKGLR